MTGSGGDGGGLAVRNTPSMFQCVLPLTRKPLLLGRIEKRVVGEIKKKKKTWRLCQM